MKDSGWRFDKISSMAIFSYKTGDLNGSKYVKFLLRSSAILNNQNNNKFCYMWSIVALLHPITDSKNRRPTGASNYRQYFNELNFNGSDFVNGYKCSNLHRFGKINNIPTSIIELGFHQNQTKWKHKLLPIEIS